MPSAVWCGAEARRKEGLNCWPLLPSAVHQVPLTRHHSAALNFGAWATTSYQVVDDRGPSHPQHAEAVSRCWNVTRSIDAHASKLVGCGNWLGF